jgi:hypothetical protein
MLFGSTSPDFVPSDFFLFGHSWIGGKKSQKKEIITADINLRNGFCFGPIPLQVVRLTVTSITNPGSDLI